MTDDIRRKYHAPPEAPREEMWKVIAARIREERVAVVDLAAKREEARRARRGWSAARGWAAAAAVLVVGIALGRATAPNTVQTTAATGPRETVVAPGEGSGYTSAALDFAARRHLGRSESLLTMVRTDAREGRVDPSIAPWARSLLMETRLLLDARRGADPTLDGLLAELELVLSQIVGMSEAAGDEGRMRTELDLTIEGMEGRAVLTRIRAAVPGGMSSE